MEKKECEHCKIKEGGVILVEDPRHPVCPECGEEIVRKTKKITTKDTYEGAYYLINGGTLTDVKISKIPENKVHKYGFTKRWAFVIEGVPLDTIREYKEGTATVNLRELSYRRKYLKKKAHMKEKDYRYFQQEYEGG